MSDAPEVTPLVAPPAPYGNYMNPVPVEPRALTVASV